MVNISVSDYEKLTEDQLTIIVKSTLRHIEENKTDKKIIGEFTIDFKNDWIRLWFGKETIGQWKLHYFNHQENTFNYLVDSIVALF